MYRRLVSGVLFAVAAVALAGAATLRVPSDYPSIGAAMHKAVEDDTILVAAGIYKEQVDLIDRIRLIGESRDSTLIIGKENRPVVLGANNAIVKSLTIKGGSAGIRCENESMVIENTVITENRESGIHCLVTLPTIRSNIIVRNDWTGVYCESSHGLNARIEHNIIAENRYSALMLAGKSEVIIQNNIICHNGQYGIFAERDSRRARIEYNAFFNNRHQSNQYAVVTGSNVVADPSFDAVRADVYDYVGGPHYSFKAMGKGGAVIGLLDEREMVAQAGDKDRDKVPDDVDQCPGVPEDEDGFEDGDGCPEFDNDGDGIYDGQDHCDNDAEDMDGFMDADGCPDPDNDRDGILDSEDQCPNQAETANGYKDEDGCPDEKPSN